MVQPHIKALLKDEIGFSKHFLFFSLCDLLFKEGVRGESDKEQEGGGSSL